MGAKTANLSAAESSALDPELEEEVIDVLAALAREGTTMVMATHDRSIVDTMRRRVIELDRGSIIRDQARGVYE